MPAYKDSNGTWFVKFRCKNWKNETKNVMKRGFSTKREAVTWEQDFHMRRKGTMDMTFAEFVKVYHEDRVDRIKQSTMATKDHIIDTKLVPAFGAMKMNEIESTDVIKWQNELLRYRDENGKPYSPVYLKTIHNQLSAIFNHAVRFYGLPQNPAKIAGNCGSEKKGQMRFWTKDEYLRFAEETMENPRAYYCFEVLYWLGIREGDLLASNREDYDLTNGKLTVNKTYHRIKGKDIITTPKTDKSVRTVTIPRFLCDELRDYFDMCYDMDPKDRAFPVSKSCLNRWIKQGAKRAGLEPIRVHDLRHSHVSLLIDLGFSALAIAERVGHEAIDITYRYAHLFPSVQTEMSDRLNACREDTGSED